MSLSQTTTTGDTMELRHKWKDNQPPSRVTADLPGFPGLPAELRNRVYEILLSGKTRMRIKRVPYATEEIVFEEAALGLSREIHAEYYGMMEAHAWGPDTTIIFTVTNFCFDKAIPIYSRIFGTKKKPSQVPKGGHGWRTKLMIRCDFDASLYSCNVYNTAFHSMKLWFRRFEKDGDNDEIDYEVGDFSGGLTISGPLMALNESDEDLWCDEFEKLRRRFKCQENAARRRALGESRLLDLLDSDDNDDEREDNGGDYMDDDENDDIGHEHQGGKEQTASSYMELMPHEPEELQSTINTVQSSGNSLDSARASSVEHLNAHNDDQRDEAEGGMEDFDEQKSDSEAKAEYDTDAEMNVSDTEDEEDTDEEDTDDEELPDSELADDADDEMPNTGYFYARRHGMLQGDKIPSDEIILHYRHL